VPQPKRSGPPQKPGSCPRTPYNSGYVGVSEDPEWRLNALRSDKTVPDTAKLLLLFEGERELCLAVERLLRPADGIGWNTAVGGVAREPPRGREPVKNTGWTAPSSRHLSGTARDQFLGRDQHLHQILVRACGASMRPMAGCQTWST